MATTSLKVQNLPRRRHFLTQSTKVDEQNSLISWKITSRHDFEEFPNRESEMEEEKHGGLDPESGLGGSQAQPEPDFLRAPVRCLASSLAPLSSDGHGQHWPLDEAFILKKGQERGFGPQGCCGRDIVHQPRWRVVQWRTWRWNPQHTPWNPCVCRRASTGERGTLESRKAPHEDVCGADATN